MPTKSAKHYHSSSLVILISVLLSMAALGAGLRLRMPGSISMIYDNTVMSYYFDKTRRLHFGGEFPRQDRWSTAPGVREENAPPLLAYLTEAAFRTLGRLSSMDFYRFIVAFPLVIFVLWWLTLLMAAFDLWGPLTAAAMAGVFAILPVSVELTRRGSYFEEVPGNWLVFVSVFLLIKVFLCDRSRRAWWMAGAIIAVTALDLCWQQFPVFYAAAFLIGLTILPWRRETRETAYAWLCILAVPLVLGHFISRIWIGTGYSPLAMLRELAIAARHPSNPDLFLAMDRNDWNSPTWRAVLSQFGWLGMGLAAAGFLRTAFNIKNFTTRAIGIFGLAGALTFRAFFKDRFLALSLCLPLMALGMDALLFPENALREAQAFFAEWARLGGRLLESRRAVIAVSSALVLGAGSAVAAWTARRFSPPPEPVVSLSGLDAPLRAGEPRRIDITLHNSGGYPPWNKNADAGLHVEVENAEVHDVNALSSGKNTVIFKDYARMGNTIFFETKYGYLGPGKIAEAIFTVIPYGDKPVRIHYRAWIPGRCSEQESRQAVQDLRPPYNDASREGWRNENCVRRAPSNQDVAIPTCRVLVFAAHWKLQDFRCFVTESAVLPTRVSN